MRSIIMAFTRRISSLCVFIAAVSVVCGFKQTEVAKNCFQKVLGRVAINELDVRNVLLNQASGVEIAKCIYMTHGAINAQGFQQNVALNVIDMEVDTSILIRNHIKSIIYSCGQRIMKTDVDSMLLCIHNESKKFLG